MIPGSKTDITLVAKAKAKIIVTLDPSIYVHCACKTAKDVWHTLHQLYEDRGLSRKIR